MEDHEQEERQEREDRIDHVLSAYASAADFVRELERRGEVRLGREE